MTSVAWSEINRGNYLSVGTLDGKVQIWDVQHQKMLRQLEGHQHRVGATSWSGSLVASGSKDKTIYVRDLRAPGSV